ncbi:MAG: carbon-nitrogen hydrolase family protein [Clostridia bacterium]|nr:carbon-nitrogen hydrolase family protein [Clostridia bacterium]
MSTDALRIALLQIASPPSLDTAREKGLAACREARSHGADVALFPEMYSMGYRLDGRTTEEWMQDAIATDHPFVLAFQEAAKALQMAIGITLLEKYQAGARNTLLLFDRFGRHVLTYAKVHTCDFTQERALTPGDAFPVTDLDTAKGPVRVGSMICYDREFPESARLLMLRGTEIILVPNACPMEINRLSQLRGRAYENMLGIATCNYPSGVPDCNGHSSAFDGVAYAPHVHGSRDTCLLEADGSEGLFLADFDLDLLRAYRKTEVHGNAYRRPELYAPLCDPKVEHPFVRADARR